MTRQDFPFKRQLYFILIIQYIYINLNTQLNIDVEVAMGNRVEFACGRSRFDLHAEHFFFFFFIHLFFNLPKAYKLPVYLLTRPTSF